MKYIITLIIAVVFVAGCTIDDRTSSQKADAEAVDRQQSQYTKSQPIPAYDYSLERDLLIQLYNIRNQKVSTHSVWRSNYGMVEDDCPSMGFGIPYDTSLTNPWVATKMYTSGGGAVAIGQPEPNGVFASTNTSATWVICIGPAGLLEPVYVESKVSVYPYPVTVDYETNRVTRAGEANTSVNLK